MALRLNPRGAWNLLNVGHYTCIKFEIFTPGFSEMATLKYVVYSVDVKS